VVCGPDTNTLLIRGSSWLSAAETAYVRNTTLIYYTTNVRTLCHCSGVRFVALLPRVKDFSVLSQSPQLSALVQGVPSKTGPTHSLSTNLHI
jgi:hypothetical protein